MSILPQPLQRVAEFLPFTHALSAIRKALLTSIGAGGLLPELTSLLLFTAVLFPLGLWTFAVATRYAKVTGTLGQY